MRGTIVFKKLYLSIFKLIYNIVFAIYTNLSNLITVNILVHSLLTEMQMR